MRYHLCKYHGHSYTLLLGCSARNWKKRPETLAEMLHEPTMPIHAGSSTSPAHVALSKAVENVGIEQCSRILILTLLILIRKDAF